MPQSPAGPRRSRIDIVCTTFNRSAAIRPTIDSVLAQSVPDWTLIVVSDGSTDDTDDVVRSYRDSRIRLIRVPPHGHPGGPRNIGVAAASSPYVCYLDHDDRWAPEHLAVLLSRLQAGAELVAAGCVRVDEHGTEQERTGLTDLIWHPELQTLNVMFEPSRVAHVRQLVPAVGGWSTNPAGYEDWDLWFRLSRAGHDFTVAEERTSIQVLAPGSRRNALRAPHAVVLERVANEDVARQAVQAVTEHRNALRQRFVDELCDWYAALADTGRYHAPAGTTVEQVREHLHGEFLDAGRPCLLEQLVYAPVRDSVALFLPIWCTSPEHLKDIGRIMHERYPSQRECLRSFINN